MSQAPDTSPSFRFNVLVVDDEKNIRTTLGMCLQSMGCTVKAASNAAEALSAVGVDFFDLAFVDLRLGQDCGLDLIPKLLAERSDLAIVVITAHASFDTAVDAIKRGATEYVAKPFTPAQIRHVVEKVSSDRAMRRKVTELQERLASSVPEAELEPRASSMRAVLDMAGRAAQSQAPVLLRGENGTGKGVLALTLHAQSPRADRAFVTVNCPTLSDELLTSELFGHVKGSFTGATRDQAGRVEAAEGGSLFLDEIGEISPSLQAKLLRFLQTKEYERVGENKTRRADVRIIAATNRDLDADVKAGRFREDLLYRLNVIEVVVPPLRERREDIIPLAKHFLNFFAKSSGRPVPELCPSAEKAISAYAWPGNVRELRNVMERALILWPARTIDVEALPARMQSATGGAPRVCQGPRPGDDISLEALEKEHIQRVSARASTSEQAAQILGIDVSTLWRKKKKYGGDASDPT